MSDYRRSRTLPPYDKDGKTNFPARNVPGVYLIYKRREKMLSVDHELLYVGYSAKDVYKAMYRHFQVWNDRQATLGQRDERTTFRVTDNTRVRVVYTRTASQAAELEKALIIKHRPPKNPDKLEWYELTEHGKALATLPGNADYFDNDEAPF